jgi:putative transferase (TIGR04331 family)
MACLEMSLGQLPFSRVGFSYTPKSSFDISWRKWTLPVKDDNKEFVLIARELLPRFLPRIFLEGFRDLMAQTENFPWPKSPKVIFTSNRHFFDDTFKAWTAQKIAKGSRLVIGEHGGMGAGLFNGAHRYELSIADVYLSTGWTNATYSNVVPLGYFKSRLKTFKPKPTGKALLVCGIMPRFSFDIRSMMLSSQVLDYFEDQFNFIDALPQSIKNQILVRLGVRDFGWQQKERWLDRHPNIEFDDGNRPMLDVASQCRLFISTYMATTYIESLTSNIPTVMFWNPSHWEATPEAQLIFDKLKEVGIFHESPEKAALHISHIWDDVPSWWQSDEVQSARKYFCDRYSATPPDIDKLLREVLIEEASRSSTLAL